MRTVLLFLVVADVACGALAATAAMSINVVNGRAFGADEPWRFWIPRGEVHTGAGAVLTFTANSDVTIRHHRTGGPQPLEEQVSDNVKGRNGS